VVRPRQYAMHLHVRHRLKLVLCVSRHNYIICTNRAIIIQFTSTVTIISVFGWRYMPYCLCEQCNKFNSAIAVAHNGLHLASCNATHTTTEHSGVVCSNHRQPLPTQSSVQKTSCNLDQDGGPSSSGSVPCQSTHTRMQPSVKLE
jgi:hypothetical protein